MKTRIKRILKIILFRLPGGRQFYNRIYLPLIQRYRTAGHPAPSAAIIDQAGVSTDYYRQILAQDLVLQEEWTLLLRDVVTHLEFLQTFLKSSDNNEQEAQELLEEFYRHLQLLLLTFRSLLARQDSQVSWLRSLLEDRLSPPEWERVKRLEKVIEYLVESQGEDQPA